MGEKAELKARIRELAQENNKLHGHKLFLQIILAAFVVMAIWKTYG